MLKFWAPGVCLTSLTLVLTMLQATGDLHAATDGSNFRQNFHSLACLICFTSKVTAYWERGFLFCFVLFLTCLFASFLFLFVLFCVFFFPLTSSIHHWLGYLQTRKVAKGDTLDNGMQKNSTHNP